jgi:AraC-like DNA-binding protein
VDRSSWHYGRRRDASQLEQASWTGDLSPALASHFHVETQVTIVVAGSRRFLTRAGPIVAHAGETAILSAGLPHCPHGLDAPGSVSLNLYLPPISSDREQAFASVVTTPAWLVADAPLERTALARWVTSAGSGPSPLGDTSATDELVAAVTETAQPVRDIAASFGLTREGFIRRFNRVIGMTPHAFRIVHRLNLARAMLAAGIAPAAAAAEAGFADQSHLGRIFRTTFGTAPAAYRRAMRD